jgi:predicted lipid-binding transport protein (Tim44 family)
MDGGSAFLEILFFGMVAAFLVLRLRSVLGKRIGHERKPQTDRDETSKLEPRVNDDNVVAMPSPRNLSDPVQAGIVDIQRADRSFDPDGFAAGAKTAFELILNAFANGDRDTLRTLCSPEVYRLLDSEMQGRETREETLESTLVRIREAKIIGAKLLGNTAQVTLRIGSEQINVSRDREGHAIQGQHGVVDSVTDIWTFSRNTASNDPNWTLTEIQDPENKS